MMAVWENEENLPKSYDGDFGKNDDGSVENYIYAKINGFFLVKTSG